MNIDKIKKSLFCFWAFSVFVLYVFCNIEVGKNYWLAFLTIYLVFGLIAVFFFIMAKLVKENLDIKERTFSFNIYQLIALFLAIIFFLMLLNAIYDWSVASGLFLGFSKVINYTFLALVQFLAIFGLGSFILKLFKYKGDDKLDHFITATGIGIGIFIFLLIGLGWLKLFYPITAWLILFTSLVLGFSPIKNLLIDSTKKLITIKIAKETILKNLSLGISIVLLAIFYLLALRGEYNTPYDSQHTYMLFPKAYVASHGFVDFPYWPYWGFPQNAEMFFSFNWLIGGATFIFVNNFFFAILFFLGLYSLAKKLEIFNKHYILVLFLTMPLFNYLISGYVKVELLNSFFYVLLINFLYKIFKDPSNLKNFFILCVFSGILTGLKYNNIIIIFSFIIVFLFLFNFKIFIKRMVLYSTLIILLSLPWLIKNYVYYQQPLYPLLPGNNIIEKQLGTNCNDYLINDVKEDGKIWYADELYKTENNKKQKIYFWEKFFRNISSLNNIGPWPYIFLLLLLFPIKDKFIKLLLLLSGLYFVFWLLFFGGQIWYLLPAIIVLFIVFMKIINNKNFLFINFFIFLNLLIILISYYQNINLLNSFRYLSGEITGNEIVNLEQSQGVAELIKMSSILDKIIEKEPNIKIWGAHEPQSYWMNYSRTNYIPDIFGYLYTCLEKEKKIDDFVKKFEVKYLLLVLRNGELKPNCDLTVCQSYYNLVDYLTKENNYKLIKKAGDYYLFKLY